MAGSYKRILQREDREQRKLLYLEGKPKIKFFSLYVKAVNHILM